MKEVTVGGLNKVEVEEEQVTRREGNVRSEEQVVSKEEKGSWKQMERHLAVRPLTVYHT